MFAFGIAKGINILLLSKSLFIFQHPIMHMTVSKHAANGLTQSFDKIRLLTTISVNWQRGLDRGLDSPGDPTFFRWGWVARISEVGGLVN